MILPGQSPLPHNPTDAEWAVVGAILVDEGAISKVSGLLSPDDFSSRWCATVYGAALDLHLQDTPIDDVTISERLRELGHWDESMEGRLASVAASVPSAASIADYARLVFLGARRRRAVRATHRLHELLVSSKPEGLPQALDDMECLLQECRSASVSLSPPIGVGWRERILGAFQLASELAAETVEGPVWISRPWIAEGTVTVVDGLPKSGGKTTFILHLVKSVLDGEPFLGEPTKQAKVVYLTEEPKPAFAAALRRAGLAGREDLHVLHRHHIAGAPWPEVIKAAVEYCQTVGAELLVIDTFPPFAGLRAEAENQAGAVLEAVDKLQEATRAGIGVLLARHERKAMGEPGSSGRGSNALTGAVETIVTIRRIPGAAPSMRRLACLSRFEEVPAELTIELGPDGFYPRETHSGEGSLARVLGVLPTSEGDALSEREVVDATKLGVSTVNRHLNSLARGDLVLRRGEGGKSDLYRYWRPDDRSFPSSQPLGGGEEKEGTTT